MRKLALEHYRVGKIRLYQRGAMGYAHCRQETGCRRQWRIQLQTSLSVAEAGAGGIAELLVAAGTPGWKLLVQAAGEHTAQPRFVRGDTVQKRRQARNVAVMPPTQGMASLVEAGIPAELFPKKSTCLAARRAAFSVGKASMASPSASAGLWAA